MHAFSPADFIQSKMDISRSILVDPINDKCAQLPKENCMWQHNVLNDFVLYLIPSLSLECTAFMYDLTKGSRIQFFCLRYA